MNNTRNAIPKFFITLTHSSAQQLALLGHELWQAGRALYNLHTAPAETGSRRARAGNRWQRALCIMLCLVLLSHHLMAAPPTLLIMANQTQASLSFWWHSSGWAAKAAAWWPQQKTADTKGWDGKGAPPNNAPDPKEQEQQSERDAKVQRIEISPRDVTLNTGEKVIFSAIAYDRSGNMIPGVKFTWDGNDEDKLRKMSVTPRGEFVSPVAGKYKVTVEALGKKDSVKVTVVGEQLNPKDKGVQGEDVSSHDQPKVQKIGRLQPVPSSPKEAVPLRKNEADKLAQVTNKTTRAAATAVAAFQSGYDYYQWNASNYLTADDPGREVGQMPGHAVDGGAGSGNFQFSAPLIGLDGRGIDVNLALYYNARLWHKNGTDMYFNVDNDYVPGWTTGFGKIITAGSGFMLIEADGTRHSYRGNTWSYAAPNSALQGFDGYTQDGTFINYYARGYKPQFNSTIVEAWAKLPNGTKITYGASTKLTAYPTNITDANGNYITITYVNNQGPNIDTITDTLGRQIKFKYVAYNGQNVVAAITAPGFNGGADRVIAQFAYDTIDLNGAGTNYGFSGVTPRVSASVITVLKAIYYPATNTGYWFDKNDNAYSPYGMIRKVSERRAMVCSNPNDTTAQANITNAGNVSREMVYSSGTTPGYSSSTGALTDVPTYTTMTEEWAGRQAGIPKPVTEYSVVSTSTLTTTKITRRDENTTDGRTSVQITDNNPASSTYGSLLEDYTLANKNDAYTAALSHSKVYWEVPDLNTYPSHYGAPRPNHTEVTDERGQTITTTYTYGVNYNQVADVREYGYNGQFLRRTHTDYINTQAYIGYWYNNAYGSYIGRHIYSLPSAVSVYASEWDDTQRVARTEYQYDLQSGQALMDTPSVPQHWNASNPYSPVYQNCYWQWNDITSSYDYVCDPPYSEYDASTDARGNISSIKRYADAQNYTSDPIAMLETRNYDICGNMRSTSSSCCEQTSLTYDSSTAYTWPSSVTRGSATDTAQQNTTSTVYDFNTGLVTSATDANGLFSTITYNATTLRPVYEYAPRNTTGEVVGYAYHEYYDDLMAVIDFVYEANQSGGTWANRVDKYLDGHGRVSEEIGFTVGYAMDVANTVYDQFGRVQKQTRPYRRNADWSPNETPQWTNYSYDTLDRVTSVTAPDGSISYRYYNESTYPSAASSATAKGTTIRVKDAWGRERWARSDEQNRLVEVVEPDPNGTSGAVATNGLLTTYAYSTLGNLIGASQGAQTRSFKYDALGRMTNQKLAERDATLDDSGNAGSTWSDYFKYDNRGNLIERRDARRVKTTFNYNNDPFNRLYQVSYDTSSAINATAIAAAATVTYKYLTTGDKTRLANVELGTPNNAITEFGEQAFTYDAKSRLNGITQSYGSNGSTTINYTFDSLDRVSNIAYPAQFGQSGNPIRNAVPTYDLASRFNSLTYNGTVVANNPVYNSASQTTDLNLGNTTQEKYTFDPQTGLLTNQKVLQGGASLLDLSYDYTQAANGTQKTGQLTKITNNKDISGNRDRQYVYDKLGRLQQVKGGANGGLWNQQYAYDRYGNRTGITQTGTTGANNAFIPMDGLPSFTYNTASNRITSANFTYDAAGNQMQSNENGLTNNYKYDAVGRLVEISNSNGTHTYAYGATNQRLQLTEAGTGGGVTLYTWDGGLVVAEYAPTGTTALQWAKSYIYLGGRLLATETTSGVQYQHPDRLGTRLTTNTGGSTVSENINLPFGAPIIGESNNLAGSATKKRFTSYERSDKTNLDYAVNRHYSAAQGRFTQVDPIGMDAVSLDDPQSLNLYAYCSNDPINQIDPDGLFSLKSLFSGIRKLFSNIFVRIAVLVALTVISFGLLGPLTAPTIVGSMQIGGGAVVAVTAGTHLTLAGWLAVGLSAASGIGIPRFGGFGGFRTPPFNGSSGVSAINSFLPQTQSQSTLIDYNGAINAARLALRKRPQCRALIAGSSGRDPVRLFETLLSKGQYKYDFKEKGFAGTDGTGVNAKTGLSGDFYYDPTVNGKTTAFGVNRTNAGAITILHELAHATGKYTHILGRRGYDYFVPQRRGDPNAPDSLNAKVAKACFG